MTNDREHESYDINRLWQDARMDANLLDAERRVRPVEVAPSGGSGSEGGAGTGSVAYPDDWDAKEYAEWSDSVNQDELDLDGPIVCRKCGEVTDDGDDYCGGDHCRMDGYDREWEAETDAIYAAEEVERAGREADEGRQDK